MITYPVKYTDFDDVEREETLYFHLTRAEMVELEASQEGGLSTALENVIKAKDQYEIIPYVKRFLLAGYGVRSSDGKTFTKSQALRDSFQTTEAYSALFMGLSSDADKASEFFNGLAPKDFRENPSGQSARERSEARMQGYRKPEQKRQQASEPETVQFAEDVQVEPVENGIDHVAQPLIGSTVEPLVTETPEEKRARLWAELEELDGK